MEIVSDYVLIVYDLPAKAKALRRQFLKQAHIIGAIQHTQSCYLLPYGAKAFQLANTLAAMGNAVVWKSHQADQKKAAEITTSYDTHLGIRCAAIEQRLVIAQDYMAAGRLKMALRMGIKSGKMLKELAQISETYNPGWFKEKLGTLTAEWKAVYQPKEPQ